MRSYTRPLMVTGLGDEAEIAAVLEPLSLRGGKQGALYDERWVQDLIQRHPHVLPIDQIEPALTPLTPVCTELPTASGAADNLLMTEDGGLVLVEAKLWRNPEARRQVVGQVLDYAKDLSGWDYEDLQKAVRAARREPAFRLYEHLCGPDAVPEHEAAFVDQVSRNLRLGRVLLVVAGDGIQESAERLADFLQRHIGLHFSLAMVEISLWRAPQGQVFVQPRVLARTVQIERAVVRFEGRAILTPAQITPASSQARPQTLSSEAFYEGLDRAIPGAGDGLKDFLRRAADIGIYPDIRLGMSLKWEAEGRSFRLAHINAQGQVNVEWAHGDAASIGRIDLSHQFLADLAAVIEGASVRRTPKPIGWRVVIDGRLPTVRSLTDEPDAWLSAMSAYIDRLAQALGEPHPILEEDAR